MFRRALALKKKLGIPSRPLLIGIAASCVLALLEGVGMSMLYSVLVFVEKGAGAFVSGAPQPLNFIADAFTLVGLNVSLMALLIAVFGLLLLRQATNYLLQTETIGLSSQVTERLRNRAVHAFIHAGLAFHTTHNRGDMISGILAAAARGGAAALKVMTLVTAGFLVSAYVVVLSFLSPLTAIILLPALAGLVFFYKRKSEHGRRIGQEVNHAYKMLVTLFGECIHGIRLLKMRRMEDAMEAQLKNHVEVLSVATMKQTRTSAMSEATTQPLLLLVTLATFYVAVSYGGMALSSMGMVVFLIIRMTPYLSSVNGLWSQLGNDLKGVEAYDAIVEQAEHSANKVNGGYVFSGLSSGIRLENVRFRYGEDSEDVLKGLSFEIGKGQTVALVGRSGAGKSTTVDLIPGFIIPSSGRILINGRPIDSYEIGSLRRKIAFVSQESILFDMTLRENLMFGVDGPLDQVWLDTVLKSTQCASFIRDLPQGLDTQVGERGVRFSGGQRQRLALARALYSRPEVLILDEPTSALDSATEALIQQTLQDLHGRMTIIIIAHRLSTVRNADRIFVLDQGKVVADGTHEQLMAAGGLYRELFELQTAA